jgi:hypothetical protein
LLVALQLQSSNGSYKSLRTWEQEVTPYWDKLKLVQQEGNNNVQKAHEQRRPCDKAMVTCY